MARIFISYSRVDRSTVNKLADLLRQAYGHVWYDKALTGGQDWWKEILRQIAECDHFIFLISREARESEYCQKELEEAQRLKKHIIPVLVRARTDPPDSLKNLHWIEMTEGVTVESLNDLYASLARNQQDFTALEQRAKCRAADVVLLQQLWPLINTRYIKRLEQEIWNGVIDEAQFNSRIRSYINLREDKPQNCFFDKQLENTFCNFDEILALLFSAVGQAFSTNELHGRTVLLHERIDARISGFPTWAVKEEAIEERFRKVNDVMTEVRKRHEALVNAIRAFEPDFNFTTG